MPGCPNKLYFQIYGQQFVHTDSEICCMGQGANISVITIFKINWECTDLEGVQFVRGNHYTA